MEDEGNHGNDETRCFILSTLAAHQQNRSACLLCGVSLPVFDRYPLVDGTFFLTPRQHSKACLPVSTFLSSFPALYRTSFAWTDPINPRSFSIFDPLEGNFLGRETEGVSS